MGILTRSSATAPSGPARPCVPGCPSSTGPCAAFTTKASLCAVRPSCPCAGTWFRNCFLCWKSWGSSVRSRRPKTSLPWRAEAGKIPSTSSAVRTRAPPLWFRAWRWPGACWMRSLWCPAPSWNRPAPAAPCPEAGSGSPATRSRRGTGSTGSGFKKQKNATRCTSTLPWTTTQGCPRPCGSAMSACLKGPSTGGSYWESGQPPKV